MAIYRANVTTDIGGRRVNKGDLIEDDNDMYALQPSRFTLEQDGPWQSVIWPTSPSASNVNWSTLTQASVLHYGVESATNNNNQNNEITFNVYLAAGTWTMTVSYYRGTDRGIHKFSIDGTALTSLGAASTTIDEYAASGGNNVDSITGIVIPTAGVKSLRILLDTKNASSSAYGGHFNQILFTRTA